MLKLHSLKSLRRSSHERSMHHCSPSPTADAPLVMYWYHQTFGSSAKNCHLPALIREMPWLATDGNCVLSHIII